MRLSDWTSLQTPLQTGNRGRIGLPAFVRQAHPFALTAKVVGASKFPDLSIAIERVDACSQSVPVVRGGGCNLNKLCTFFHYSLVPSLIVMRTAKQCLKETKFCQDDKSCHRCHFRGCTTRTPRKIWGSCNRTSLLRLTHLHCKTASPLLLLLERV